MRDRATLTIGFCVAVLLLSDPASAQSSDTSAGFVDATGAVDGTERAVSNVGRDLGKAGRDAAALARDTVRSGGKAIDDGLNDAWAATVAPSSAKAPTLSEKPREVRVPKPKLAARPNTATAPSAKSGKSTAWKAHALSGIASYYWQGQQTASGEPFDKRAMTAAHPSLPFGTKVRVYCANTGREVVVRINDRGPFKPGRVIDLSEAAAEVIGMRGRGLTMVQLEVVRN